MGTVVASEDCAGVELEHTAVEPMVVDYSTAHLDCGPCSIQPIEQACSTFSGLARSCTADCAAAVNGWYEGYARDHWAECTALLSADRRLHESDAGAERTGAMYTSDELHELYATCNGDAPAWSPTAERCQLVFQAATDACVADGVDMETNARCGSITCETAVQHVLALHGNCTAHSADVWPMEAARFDALAAVSCPCADHDLAVYLNPELHPDVPASFAGYTCNQLVAEHESYCHYDASVLSPSLRGLTGEP
jgi:hypothetical protein